MIALSKKSFVQQLHPNNTSFLFETEKTFNKIKLCCKKITSILNSPLSHLQTISTASELRVPVYAAVAAHSVNAELLLQMMNGVRFDIKDIMSQHSQYVDIVLQVTCLIISITNDWPMNYYGFKHCWHIKTR